MQRPVLAIALVLLGLFVPLSAAADGPPIVQLPEPFGAISTLDDDQRARMVAVVLDARQNLHETEEKIRKERGELHRRWGSPSRARDGDIGKHLREARRSNSWYLLTGLSNLLKPEQIPEYIDRHSKMTLVAQAQDFPSFFLKQEGTNWCWAAGLQALFYYNGVFWDQDQIVQLVKDEIVPSDRAEPEEIDSRITGFHIQADDPSENWIASAEFDPEPLTETTGASAYPRESVLVQMLNGDDPMLVAIQHSHLVIVYQANYHELPDGPNGALTSHVESITYYDPLANRKCDMKWTEFTEAATGWWRTVISLSNGRIF